MKHNRIIRMIEGKLSEGTTLNTVEIKEFINNNTRNGIDSNALGNILSKNKQFESLGKERIKGVGSGSYLVTLWRLK